MGYIYKITNQINGKSYVGQTINSIALRLRIHIKDAKAGCDLLLHRSIRKYGKEHFTIELLEEVNNENLNLAEIRWIAHEKTYFKEYPNGYNLTRGGEGFSSEQSREIQARRLANGTHHLQGEHGSNRATAQNLQRVAEGTHPFLRINETLLLQGRHHSQRTYECPHCGKIGKGSAMKQWHFNKCKEKP